MRPYVVILTFILLACNAREEVLSVPQNGFNEQTDIQVVRSKSPIEFKDPKNSQIVAISTREVVDASNLLTERSKGMVRFISSNEYESFPDELESRFEISVDQEFSAANERSGISLAVYSEGRSWTHAQGEADIGVRMTPATPLIISSTSKTFLSALILSQVEDGFYQLEDNIQSVLANHPKYSMFSNEFINEKVTVRQLLAMSSGLSKFDGNIQGKSSSFKEKIWLPSNTIGLIKSPYQLPGKFQYNDTNVVLLGIIAEFHSGSSLADLYRKEFLDPLNIQAITLPEEGIKWHEDIFNDTGGDFTQPVLAFPYTDVTRYGTKGFGNLIRTAPFEVGYYIGAVRRLSYACCGIVSTPENIARWAYELYSPQGTAITTFTRAKLIDSTSTDRVPPWVVKDGNDKYGYLISERRFDMNGDAFVKAYGHPGGGGGYSSVMYYSPELDLAVSILANSEMGFRGSCRGEKPLNCIVTDIFRTYWSFLNE